MHGGLSGADSGACVPATCDVDTCPPAFGHCEATVCVPHGAYKGMLPGPPRATVTPAGTPFRPIVRWLPLSMIFPFGPDTTVLTLDSHLHNKTELSADMDDPNVDVNVELPVIVHGGVFRSPFLLVVARRRPIPTP